MSRELRDRVDHDGLTNKGTLSRVATRRLRMGKTHAFSEPHGPNQGYF